MILEVDQHNIADRDRAIKQLTLATRDDILQLLSQIIPDAAEFTQQELVDVIYLGINCQPMSQSRYGGSVPGDAALVLHETIGHLVVAQLDRLLEGAGLLTFEMLEPGDKFTTEVNDGTYLKIEEVKSSSHGGEMNYINAAFLHDGVPVSLMKETRVQRIK